ncbi:MAG: ABC transporter permease [Candidatus Sumerlaeota bacterium]|nr:ABC transporter permease [Candidatus Sumerlaeota bacterium]
MNNFQPMMNLKNAFSAALRLANLQVFGRKRRLITILALAFPIMLAVLYWVYSPHSAAQAYPEAVAGIFTGILVPFLAIFWGSALISDEVEGKTLVFLWTRPLGRIPLFLFKFVIVVFYLTLLVAVSVAAVFALMYGGGGGRAVADNLVIAGYDVSALTLGGLAYAAFAFFLAAMLKKPLVIGLFYVFTWDGFAQFLPGYLKLFSIRHYIFVLSSRPQANQPEGFLRFLGENTTTEAQALITLLCVTIVFLSLGCVLLRNREFLGDDPARSQ